MLPSPLEQVPKRARKTFDLQKGELLFRQGDPTDGLCFVERGQIELHRYTETGECLVVHRARALETFAEASLFSASYHCDAVATETSLVRKFEKPMVLELFANNPKFAENLAATFVSQIQTLRRRIELLAIKSAKERVFMAINEEMMTGSIISFAHEIGLTHEATYRALAALVRDGPIVKVSRGRYEIRQGHHAAISS